jgi:hypothetical protein
MVRRGFRVDACIVELPDVSVSTALQYLASAADLVLRRGCDAPGEPNAARCVVPTCSNFEPD